MKSIAQEYIFLFNTITEAEEELCKLRETLISAQRQAEELFLEENEPS